VLEIRLKDKAIDLIRDRDMIETQDGHLLAVLRFAWFRPMRFCARFITFAVDMNWLRATDFPSGTTSRIRASLGWIMVFPARILD